jgi:hypothetical protein
MNAWQAKLLGYLVAALIGFVAGVSLMQWRSDRNALKGIQAGVASAQKENTRRDVVATKYEDKRREIDRYYAQQRAAFATWLQSYNTALATSGGCVLDDAGLRLWNGANNPTTSADPGELSPRVRYDATDADVGGDARSAGQPHSNR